MKFEKLSIPGLYLLTLDSHLDERGFFLERHRDEWFRAQGIEVSFVQDNHSQSKKGVLRGLHFQSKPKEQDKLVWVVRGKIWDVAVDIRKDSKTFGKYEAVELSEENQQMFFIPKGFAHGFVTLSEKADVLYKTSEYYSKKNDKGLLWNDPEVGIKWPMENPIVSEKDSRLPSLKHAIN